MFGGELPVGDAVAPLQLRSEEVEAVEFSASRRWASGGGTVPARKLAGI